jgi:hypothetical protein
MRALLVAALLAGCHHAPPLQAPAPTPTPVAAQPAPHRGPGRADVDPEPAAMPLVETVSTTRPCIPPTSDPLPAVPPRTNGQHYILRNVSGCARIPVVLHGERRIQGL